MVRNYNNVLVIILVIIIILQNLTSVLYFTKDFQINYFIILVDTTIILIIFVHLL